MFKRKLSARTNRLLLVIAIIATVIAIEYFRQIPVNVITHELQGEFEDEEIVRLLAVGDVGAGDEAQRRVAATMEKLCDKYGIDGVLFLGDNFYNDGVKSIDDPQWQDKFQNVYNGPCLEGKRFYAALGNHDYRGSPAAQIAYTEKGEGRWNLPARYYKVEFGDVMSLFIMDSNFPDRCGLPMFCSLDWLQSRMKTSRTSWKLLIGHHPIMSGGKYGKVKFFQSLMIPPFYCRSGADLYLSGHDHNFQHLIGRYEGYDCEVNQVIAGTGGGPLNDVEAIPDLTRYQEKSHGVAMLEVSDETFGLKFFREGETEPAYEYSMNHQ